MIENYIYSVVKKAYFFNKRMLSDCLYFQAIIHKPNEAPIYVYVFRWLSTSQTKHQFMFIFSGDYPRAKRGTNFYLYFQVTIYAYVLGDYPRA